MPMHAGTVTGGRHRGHQRDDAPGAAICRAAAAGRSRRARHRLQPLHDFDPRQQGQRVGGTNSARQGTPATVPARSGTLFNIPPN